LKQTFFIPILFLSLACWLVAGSPARATFPGKDISFWTEHEAKTDRQNPQYLKFHEMARSKNFEKAQVLIDEIIAKNPGKGTPHILKALLLNELGDYKKALQELQRGRDIQRRHPAIHYGHCQIYRNLGEALLSDRACKIASQQHPKSPEAHYEYAQTLAALGNMGTAIQELGQAAALDPKNPTYFYEQGMNYFYLNRFEKAEKAFMQALILNPDDLESEYQLGYLHAIQNNLKKAQEHLNRVWDSRKNHSKVEAARTLLELIKKNQTGSLPKKVVAYKHHLSRSRSLYQSGQYGLSLFEIQTAARLNPDDVAIHEILVGLSSMLLRLDLAEKSVKHLLSITADIPVMQSKGYQELADLSVMRGKLDAARKIYEKSKTMGDPNQLAQVSLKELPTPGARHSQPLDSREIFIQPTEAMNRKGEVFAHYGMFERALGVYAMILRIDPANLMGKLNSAAAYYNGGQNNRAISLLEKIFISHPNHPHVLSHHVLLAKAYCKKGDIDLALKNLLWIKQTRPEILQTLKTDPAFEKIKGHELFQ